MTVGLFAFVVAVVGFAIIYNINHDRKLYGNKNNKEDEVE